MSHELLQKTGANEVRRTPEGTYIQNLGIDHTGIPRAIVFRPQDRSIGIREAFYKDKGTEADPLFPASLSDVTTFVSALRTHVDRSNGKADGNVKEDLAKAAGILEARIGMEEAHPRTEQYPQALADAYLALDSAIATLQRGL